MSNSVINEFVSKSSDDEIKFLGMRLNERLQGDLDDVFNFVSRNNNRNIDIDELFKSTTTAVDLYDYCDQLQFALEKEADRRNILLTRGNV